MEYWVRKADKELIIISDQQNLNKIGSQSAQPIIPTFQYTRTFTYLNPAGETELVRRSRLWRSDEEILTPAEM